MDHPQDTASINIILTIKRERWTRRTTMDMADSLKNGLPLLSATAQQCTPYHSYRLSVRPSWLSPPLAFCRPLIPTTCPFGTVAADKRFEVDGWRVRDFDLMINPVAMIVTRGQVRSLLIRISIYIWWLCYRVIPRWPQWVGSGIPKKYRIYKNKIDSSSVFRFHPLCELCES